MAILALRLNVQPLQRSFQAAQRGLWLQKALLTMARSLCVALALGLAGALSAGWQAPEPVSHGFWTVAALAPLAGLLAAAALRPSVSEAARVVDDRLGLWQQLGTAQELLARGASGEMVSLQLARASNLASGLPLGRAFPLVPGRELALAALLALATASMLLLVEMGVILPNPLAAIRLPSFSREAAIPADLEPFTRDGGRDALKSRSLALEPVRQMMDEIQRRTERGSLSPAAAAAALAQANAELNRVANESRIRQQALENLANELRGTAAGREAAESLRQGNYDQAAQQLGEIGQQSDQLSQAAKRELSEALNRSARRSQEARDLATKESQAARSLQQENYQSVVQSMDKLAQSVQDAAGELVPQSELAEAWQQLEEMGKQLGDLNPRNNEGRGALSPPVAQAPQNAGERTGSMQQGEPGGQQGLAPGPAGTQGQMQDNQLGAGGQPGNGPGGPPLGNENRRLGPDGKPLEVEGQIGDKFSGEPGSESESPSVLREGKVNSLSSDSNQGSNGPISVPAENVFVPGDRRSTVREYFSRGSGGQ